MGLDMTLSIRTADNVPDEEIGDWRKHANLHGYLGNLYRQRGGGGEEFNCVPFELTKADCEDIIELSNNNALEIAHGFFWGETHPEHNDATIKYMRKAIKAIDNGKTVIYNSWW